MYNFSRMDYSDTYPHLFNEVIWPWGPTRARFQLLEELPPAQLISNINIVPLMGDSWVIIQHQHDNWDIPGGTIEEDENVLDTLHRELMEEAGARLLSFSIFGAWHCFSLAEKSYRPHLPHPEYYRVVGIGEVEIVQNPTNPEFQEQIAQVEAVSLQTVLERFRADGRPDLAELYQLAARVATGKDLPRNK